MHYLRKIPLSEAQMPPSAHQGMHFVRWDVVTNSEVGMLHSVYATAPLDFFIARRRWMCTLRVWADGV